MNKKNKMIIILFYCSCAALLLSGTLWDEQISRFLYSPDSVFCSFFNKIGEFPPYLTIPLFGTVFFYGKPEKVSKALGFLWSFFFAVICLGGFIFLTTKFGSYWLPENDLRTPIEIVLAVVFTVLSLILGKRIPKKHLKPLKRFSVFGVLAFLISGLGVDFIKSIWGRTRPRDMLKINDFSSFTPWYIPQGKTGNNSFPSGHANQATLMFLLTGLADAFSSLKKHEVKLFLASALFSFTVSLSRLIVGAHFLTDVTVAIIITFTTVYILRILIFKNNKNNNLI